jgi:hypothetical protein
MIKDISGQMFGALRALKLSHFDKWRTAHWLCVCKCGKQVAVSGIALRAGKTKSCGCLRAAKASAGGYLLGKRRNKHG